MRIKKVKLTSDNKIDISYEKRMQKLRHMAQLDKKGSAEMSEEKRDYYALPYYSKRCMVLEDRIAELEGQMGMLREALEELFDTAKGINYRFTMDCMGPSLTEKVEKALSQTAQAAHWEAMRRVVEAAKKVSAVWDDNDLIMFARQSESAKNRLELKQALAALERSENHESNG